MKIWLQVLIICVWQPAFDIPNNASTQLYPEQRITTHSLQMVVLIFRTTLGPLYIPCPFLPAVAVDHRWWCWYHWESPRWRAWPPQLAPAQSDAGTSVQSWWKCHRPCPAHHHESLQPEKNPVKQWKPKLLLNNLNSCQTVETHGRCNKTVTHPLLILTT